jgi:hypothetical protein
MTLILTASNTLPNIRLLLSDHLPELRENMKRADSPVSLQHERIDIATIIKIKEIL